ncbi:hypothetical protein DAMDJJ_28055 [Cupriavidus necator]
MLTTEGHTKLAPGNPDFLTKALSNCLRQPQLLAIVYPNTQALWHPFRANNGEDQAC